MKKNFKKLMSVLLVAIMIGSIFSISVSAASYTITLDGGYKGNGANRVYGLLNNKLSSIAGDTYTDENGIVYTIDKENNTITFKTDSSGKFTFPEYFFDMAGYTQTFWGTRNNSTAGKKSAGDSGSVRKNTTYYAGYAAAKYTVSFVPGAEGSGEAKSITDLGYDKDITLEADIFTRAGYAQIGWATTENATEVEFELSALYTVVGNVTLYPVWQKAVLSVSCDNTKFTFGSLCVDYITPDAQMMTITNNGNSAIKVTIPVSTAFNVVADDTVIAPSGGTLTVSVQPKAGLVAGKYLENLFFDFGNDEINFVATAKFVVNEHLFVKYVSDGNATYSANGTETAECFSGCGAKHNRVAEGSMKKVLASNNTAEGLLEEYLYHKTVKFVAFGSGMDAAEGDVIETRYRPTEWSVADTNFSGKFDKDTADYTVKYDHGDGNFGTYTLTIKYVEEKNENGEWVATGTEDVKTFEYSIGPSEKDNQEVVRPNMIVSIIFGLFGYLIELLTSGSLF